MAYNKEKETHIQNTIKHLTDAEIALLISLEINDEDREADRKMMAALEVAPPQLKKAWKLANDALGMMSLRSVGTPLNEKISDICWALSDWAEELAAKDDKRSTRDPADPS